MVRITFARRIWLSALISRQRLDQCGRPDHPICRIFRSGIHFPVSVCGSHFRVTVESSFLFRRVQRPPAII